MISRDVQLKVLKDEAVLFETASFASVQAAAFLGSTYVSEHSVILQDYDIDIADNLATTDVVIISSGQTIENDDFRELFTATIKLEKIEEDWIITSVEGDRMTPGDDE